MNISEKFNKTIQSDKTNSLVLLVLFILAGCFLPQKVFAGLNSSIPSFRTSSVNVEPPRFVLKTSLPDVTAQVPLIETTVPDAKREFANVAEKLGLSGKTGNNGHGKIGLRHNAGKNDQQSLVMFDASAGYVYEYDNKLHPIVKEQPKLPDDARALNIALDYLKSKSLLPKDVDIEQKNVTFSRTELSQFDAKSNRILQQFVTGVDVRFEQNWESIPVSGPGSKLYVSIGDGGEVVGLTNILRKGRKTETALKTISPDNALANLSKNVNSQLSIPVGCSEAEITQFRLVYWSESPTINQRVAWPVYNITGQCKNEAGLDLGEFEAYTEATIMPENFPKANPRRKDEDQDNDS